MQKDTPLPLPQIEYIPQVTTPAGNNTGTLQICSWNINGIRANLAQGGFQFLITEQPDIILLQETKCAADRRPQKALLDAYHMYFLDGSKSGHYGVAIYSNIKPIRVTAGIGNNELDHEGRIITAEFDNDYVINVYEPTSGMTVEALPKRLMWDVYLYDHLQKLMAHKQIIL